MTCWQDIAATAPAAGGGAKNARKWGLTFLVAVCAWLVPLPVPAQGAEGGLRAQLEDLAGAEGLAATGLERIGDAPARRLAGNGDLAQRLQSLLHGYNYLLLHDAAGEISGLRILGAGRAGPPEARQVAVPATRRGAHHLVDAVLLGPTGIWESRRLILDTGASTIVLPASAISRLGFRETDLAEGWVDTAGGRVAAKTGQLASVTVGQAVVRDVAVTFIADEQVGQSALLGMSFLDRFQLTIDDAANRIILIAK